MQSKLGDFLETKFAETVFNLQILIINFQKEYGITPRIRTKFLLCNRINVRATRSQCRTGNHINLTFSFCIFHSVQSVFTKPLNIH